MALRTTSLKSLCILCVSVPLWFSLFVPAGAQRTERLRGAMIGRVNAEDLRTLGKVWGANHVRWQLTWDGFPRSKADSATPAEYDAWLDAELTRLDSLLPVCEESGLKVLIDLHTGPGGRDDANVCRVFTDGRFQQQFLDAWQRLAKRYRDKRIVWGYDLLNEPVEPKTPVAGVGNWQELAEKAAKLVRSIDANKPIVVEPAPWGGPEALPNLKPIAVRGIVYSVHMYVPHQFTHQGVFEKSPPIRYPGFIAGKQWDKDQIRRTLQPVVEFERRNHASIYVGEFSTIRWAPGAVDYLHDLIDVLEENRWSWAYHAYREWDGWSVEHSDQQGDIRRSAAQTDREQLLRSWFAKNRSTDKNDRLTTGAHP